MCRKGRPILRGHLAKSDLRLDAGGLLSAALFGDAHATLSRAAIQALYRVDAQSERQALRRPLVPNCSHIPRGLGSTTPRRREKLGPRRLLRCCSRQTIVAEGLLASLPSPKDLYPRRAPSWEPQNNARFVRASASKSLSSPSESNSPPQLVFSGPPALLGLLVLFPPPALLGLLVTVPFPPPALLGHPRRRPRASEK